MQQALTGPAEGWTTERIDVLKDLWAKGESAGKISAKLGHVSSSAVTGKIWRLGLAGKGGNCIAPKPKTPIVPPRNNVKAQPAKTQSCDVGAKILARPGETVAPNGGKGVTLLELDDARLHRLCRWPLGNPRDAVTHFCGCKTVDGKSYCRKHLLESTCASKRALLTAQLDRPERAPAQDCVGGCV